MTKQTIIQKEIKDGFAKIKTALPGFKTRGAQNYMIGRIASVLTTSAAENPPAKSTGAHVLCVNGGTGIGKSLGYILPAAVIAKNSEKKLVISSSTVGLQEQLFDKDLPTFLGAIGLGEMRVVLAKGRKRYACEYKLRNLADALQQDALFADEAAGSLDKRSREKIIQLLEAFDARKWDGDRDNWETLEEKTWSRVTTDRHGCLGSSCECFRSCPQVIARDKIKRADIIVANHSLVLSDLWRGNGKILPKPEDTLYVLDEAHNLPDKAVECFASEHGITLAIRMSQDLENLTESIGAGVGDGNTAHWNAIGGHASSLRESLMQMQRYFRSLNALKPTQDCPAPTLEFRQGALPEEVASIGANIVTAATSLAGLLEDAHEKLLTRMTGKGSAGSGLEKLASEVALSSAAPTISS